MDGITDSSMASVFTIITHRLYPPHCTAQACRRDLKYHNVRWSANGGAVVVGRNLVVGKPAAMMLDRGKRHVTLCNSHTRDLPALCREGNDVLVVAIIWAGGEPSGPDCLREGQVVVDVGIHVKRRASSAAMCPLMRQNPSWEAVPRCPAVVWAQ